MLFWTYDHPTWTTALLFNGGIRGGVDRRAVRFSPASAQMAAPRRSRQPQSRVGDVELCLTLPLLLGLLAVAAYTSHSATGDQVTASLAALYRDVSGLPQPVRGDLQGILRRYTREVIDVGWPAQRAGVVPTTGSALMAQFNDELHAVKPAGLGQQTLHAQAMAQANALV